MDDALTRAVDERRAALIGLAQDLVRIPTLNPPGRCYREICDYLAARFVDRVGRWSWCGRRGRRRQRAFPRWNVVARLESGRAGDCVHFNGHHDVVEVGHGWTRDPIGGEVEGDRLYGRGSCDMKGGLAAAIVAAEAFVAAVPDWRGSIEVSATADEESGGYGGVAWLAERGVISRRSGCST